MDTKQVIIQQLAEQYYDSQDPIDPTLNDGMRERIATFCFLIVLEKLGG